MNTMKKHFVLALITAATPAIASDAVKGIETFHQSPNGIAERCVRIAPAPGGTYGKNDLEQ